MEDYYKALGVPRDASAKVISKTFRKKALKYHPDKNPSSEAAEIFDILQKAYEVLGDEKARGQYDEEMRAKVLQQKRLEEMEGDRVKLKKDLDYRERKADEQKKLAFDLKQEQAARAEFERRRAQAEMEKPKEKKREPQYTAKQLSLRVKWDTGLHPPYSADELRAIFSIFGEVKGVVTKSAGGIALISFGSIDALHAAASHPCGRKSNPLKVRYLHRTMGTKRGSKKAPATTLSFNDYESITMMQLRREAERQKLLAQLRQEEATENIGQKRKRETS